MPRCGLHMEVRGQLGVACLPLPCGGWGQTQVGRPGGRGLHPPSHTSVPTCCSKRWLRMMVSTVDWTPRRRAFQQHSFEELFGLGLAFENRFGSLN